jgi:hypothetical protein
MFLRHVLTGAVKFPSALSLLLMCTRSPHVRSPPSSTLVSFSPFLSYCVREGLVVSLILPGEPDDGVRVVN